jgi:hypothetical protein
VGLVLAYAALGDTAKAPWTRCPTEPSYQRRREVTGVRPRTARSQPGGSSEEAPGRLRVA